MTDIVPSQPTEAEASAAWQVQKRILKRVADMRRAWVELARDLYLFDSAQMYRDLGYDSIGEWMADPDVEIDRSWGYMLIGTWKDLVVAQDVDPDVLAGIEPTKIQNVLPAVRRGQISVEEALEDCRTLGRQDLRERYVRKPDTSTVYDPDEEPAYAVCHLCGSRYRRDTV